MRSGSGRLVVIWAFEFHRRRGATACVSQTHTGSGWSTDLGKAMALAIGLSMVRNDARPFLVVLAAEWGWQDAKYFMIIGPSSVGSLATGPVSGTLVLVAIANAGKERCN
ncbi:hypothetical protein QCA50_003541 [Cerrena zonata]|uniref:Uncharacterized protein n=1 Tax=Cerrena zonata TaxID=2478898 RepID=A0AAW0GKK4_9APHY